MSFYSTYIDCVCVTGRVIVQTCVYEAVSSERGCVIDRQDAFSRS